LSAPLDPLAAILLRGRERKGMGKGKEGDGKGEGRKGREEKGGPRPGLRKCKGGNPKNVGSANYAWGE